MASEAIEHEEIETEIEEEEGEQVEVWDDWQSDEEDPAPDYLCLFCDLRFDSTDVLFDHCRSEHYFDFHGIVKNAGLDFYASFKLINYVRSQVAGNKCWSCGATFQCNKDLQNHLHTAVSYKNDGKLLWEDDLHLKPFMMDDALLHSFGSEEEDEDVSALIDREELMRDLMNSEDLGHLAEICNDGQSVLDICSSELDVFHEISNKENTDDNAEKIMANGTVVEKTVGDGASHYKWKDKQLRVSFANVAAKEIKNVNDNYFGAYGSFGIHREMLGDKVRMDAYRGAILNNPSLMNRATVMDVGCGTGILSLFAAQAGASRVIAVEASAKMATVATQIVKDNGLLLISHTGEEKQCSGVINVVQSMVEDLDKFMPIVPNSVDVLVSEWMGYCLLYESMLSSVLYARDHWLKPGGAILPDTATIFVAGFGRGGTSLPFWENVYGFNMSCIGKEVVEDATHVPIVDVVDCEDIMTEPAILQSFDLASMKPDEMDFTTTCELQLKSDLPGDSIDAKSGTSWCHGIVLWFETGFTSRFCKEKPTVLSTSPYSPKTHWSQTILTFQEPIAMASARSIIESAGPVGTQSCPAVKISSRISIARSHMHRSIDISVETTGISSDGQKHSWPAHIFKL